MFFRFRHQRGQAAATGQRLRRFRPRLEALEERTLLTLNFNSALNLDTYAWVRLHGGDPLLPLDPIPKDPNDLAATLQFNSSQGRSPDSVAIGDFNGDGIPDIAVADANAGARGKISVILGSGDGTFAHTQPVVDLTTSPQTIRLLDSGGIAPHGLVAAQLRGAGNPLDLIVVNRGDDFGFGANVSVLLGNGDGTFQEPVSYVAGFFPTAIAVGAFRDNGPLDVVVANRTIFPGRATLLMGDGKGGFSSRQDLGLFDASQFPESVAVGDFGNHHLDFVTANSASNNVTVVLGNGDGTFKSAITYGMGTTPVAVAVAAMKPAENKLDIITANHGGNDVSILLGNGDGTFRQNTLVNFAAGATPTSVVVGSFDGKGPGLAVTNGEDSDAGSNSVSVLTFNPQHTAPDNSDLLFAPASFRAGQHPVSVAAAQLRPGMPGVIDLVVANVGSTQDRGSVSVFLNDNHANFPTPGSFPAGLQPDSVAVGHLGFQNNGLPDIVAANFGTNDLSILENDPQSPPGTNFVPYLDPFTGAPFVTGGVGPRKVLLGHFHDPNLLDIAVADEGDFGVLQGNVTLFLNSGVADQPFTTDPARHLVRIFLAARDAYLRDMALGHFNPDGNLDVAVLFFNAVTLRFGVAILSGDGHGNFTLGSDTLLPEGTNPTSIAVGDFNGDGKDDIAVTSFKERADPQVDQPTLWVLFGDGNGKFGSMVGVHAGTRASFVATGNLRGDSRVDLIVANANFPGGVTVFLNDDNGAFGGSPTTYFAGTTPVSIVVADLNGDGVLDLAIANLNGDSVSVLYGKKSNPGTFEDTVAYVTGGVPDAIAAADFFNHADGRLDLITSDSASNDVSVIENIGPPPPPGGGAAAALPIGQECASTGSASSDLNHWFMVLGSADLQPKAPVGQSDAQAILDKWHPAARRHRIDDNEMFLTLLVEEDLASQNL